MGRKSNFSMEGVIFQNQCCQIYCLGNGDLELRIIGKESLGMRYITVAKVPSGVKKEEVKKFVGKSTKAFIDKFSDLSYGNNYRKRAEKGLTSPYTMWKKIRRIHKLPRDYDIKGGKV